MNDSEEILEKIVGLHNRVLEVKKQSNDEQRKIALDKFANYLHKLFYSFEPDFFQLNISRFVDDEIALIKSSMELWPQIVEICYYAKDTVKLPQTKVKNIKIK